MILLSTSQEERATPYLEALKAVGVPAERLRVMTPAALGSVGEAIAGATGLVLCGGVDVDPARYGETTRPDAGVEVLAERDELEWQLLTGARERRLPVWGVCRGLQTLNVFLGGSLWQDLPSQRPGALEHSQPVPVDALVHAVQANAETALGDRLSQDIALVNSRHHQAIRELAPGLRAAAVSSDQLIEAVEGADADWWLRAVQWHPENLVGLAQQRRLWLDFAEAVG
jgi:putative glutamine amidotransferase